MSAWWIRFEDRDPGCVLAPDEDEALCIAEEETGSRAQAALPLQRPGFPLLNCPGGLQRSGLMTRCLSSYGANCPRECALRQE